MKLMGLRIRVGDNTGRLGFSGCGVIRWADWWHRLPKLKNDRRYYLLRLTDEGLEGAGGDGGLDDVSHLETRLRLQLYR